MKKIVLKIGGIIIAPVIRKVVVFLFIMLTVGVNTLFSQMSDASLICSAGETFITANQSVEFTIGDIAVETYQNSNSALTQGFLQGKTQGTGINTNFVSRFNISIFPNPASDDITVSFNKKAVSIEIFDLNGRKFYTLKNPQKTETLDLKSFNKGIYMLRVVFEGNIPITKHIIKY